MIQSRIPTHSLMETPGCPPNIPLLPHQRNDFGLHHPPNHFAFRTHFPHFPPHAPFAIPPPPLPNAMYPPHHRSPTALPLLTPPQGSTAHFVGSYIHQPTFSPNPRARDLRKQRPSKRARQRMKKRLHTDDQNHRDSNRQASESGYETTGDCQTPKKTNNPPKDDDHIWSEAPSNVNNGIDNTLAAVEETIHSRSDSASSLSSLNVSDTSLKKLLKDLHRCSVSITRYQAMLIKHCDEGMEKLVHVFASLRRNLSDRETDLTQELTSIKDSAGAILQRRKETAAYLRQAAEQCHLLEEVQVTELKQQIKQFVTDRKVDEEIGTIARFQADKDDLLPHIMGFGKVNNVRHLYTEWEENPAQMIEISKHRVFFPSVSVGDKCSSLSSESQESICDGNLESENGKPESDSAFIESSNTSLDADTTGDDMNHGDQLQDSEMPGSGGGEESKSSHTSPANPERSEVEPRNSESGARKQVNESAQTNSEPNSMDTSVSSEPAALEIVANDNRTLTEHIHSISRPPQRKVSSHKPTKSLASVVASGASSTKTVNTVPALKKSFKKNQDRKRSSSVTAKKGPREIEHKQVSVERTDRHNVHVTEAGKLTHTTEHEEKSNAATTEDPAAGDFILTEGDVAAVSQQLVEESRKYSADEIRQIQQRVRDSLQQQGVYLYDPVTGDGPPKPPTPTFEEPTKTAEGHSDPSPALRKKKTPTQLRRERKKRQKERERRQRELEQKAQEEALQLTKNSASTSNGGQVTTAAAAGDKVEHSRSSSSDRDSLNHDHQSTDHEDKNGDEVHVFQSTSDSMATLDPTAPIQHTDKQHVAASQDLEEQQGEVVTGQVATVQVLVVEVVSEDCSPASSDSDPGNYSNGDNRPNSPVVQISIEVADTHSEPAAPSATAGSEEGEMNNGPGMEEPQTLDESENADTELNHSNETEHTQEMSSNEENRERGNSEKQESNSCTSEDGKIAISVSIETDVQPVTSEGDIQPDASERGTQTDVSVTDVQPDTNERDTQPDDSERDTQPDTSERDIQPDTNERDTQPDDSERDTQPDTSERDIQPDISERDVEPDASKTHIQPDVSAQPDVSETDAQPVASEREVQPHVSETDIQRDTQPDDSERDAPEDMNRDSDDSTTDQQGSESISPSHHDLEMTATDSPLIPEETTSHPDTALPVEAEGEKELEPLDGSGEKELEESAREMELNEPNGERELKQPEGERGHEQPAAEGEKEAEGERELKEAEGEKEVKEAEGDIEQPEGDRELKQPEGERGHEQPAAEGLEEAEGERELKEAEGEKEVKEAEGDIEQPEGDRELEQPERERELEQPERERELEQPEGDRELEQPEGEIHVELQPQPEIVDKQPGGEKELEQLEREIHVDLQPQRPEGKMELKEEHREGPEQIAAKDATENTGLTTEMLNETPPTATPPDTSPLDTPRNSTMDETQNIDPNNQTHLELKESSTHADTMTQDKPANTVDNTSTLPTASSCQESERESDDIRVTCVPNDPQVCTLTPAVNITDVDTCVVVTATNKEHSLESGQSQHGSNIVELRHEE